MVASWQAEGGGAQGGWGGRGWRMSIYKSVSVSFVVAGVPVGFEAVEVD